MSKSADAFRTISEVAEWLGVQPHVLRFWESKFAQVKPTKRAGGRRYYRPYDMQLLGGIRKLLHEDGLTIKGVQKVIREEGAAHVADMSPPLDTQQSQIPFDDTPIEELVAAPVIDPAQPDMFAEAEEDSAEAAPAPTPEPEGNLAASEPVPTFSAKPRGSDQTPPPHANESAPLTAPDAPQIEANADASVEPVIEPVAHAVPDIIDAPDPDESALSASPSAFSAAIRFGAAAQSPNVPPNAFAPLLARLAAHRDALAQVSDGAAHPPA